MFRKTILALPFVAVVLTGCQNGNINIPPVVIGDAAACAGALLATGAMDPAALAMAALTTPACQGLAKEALNAIIDLVATKNAARRGLVRP